MREEEVAVLPKTMFLIASIVGYFTFLFTLTKYVKSCNKPSRKFIFAMAGVTLAFVVLMITLREIMFVNILITVVYVFIMLLTLLRARRCVAGQGAA